MRNWLLILALILAPLASQASRVVEVEDYFTKKTAGFIKMRYPNRPYTVQVRVEAGDTGERRVTPKDSKSVTSLPYLEYSGDGEQDVWSQGDIPLGTLISYVRSVSVNIEIDAGFSGEERQDFEQQLFKYLKLSSAYDRVEVRKMDWVKSPQGRQNRWILLGAIGIPILLALFFLIVSRLSIRQLVKGLTEPLVAIGQNTENMATPSMAPGSLDSLLKTQDKVAETLVPSGPSSKASFEDLLDKNKKYFETPSGELMTFLNTQGEKHPGAVGAILSELPLQALKELVRWGDGDWWHQAVTQPSAADSKAVQILGEMNGLRLRENLSGKESLRSAETLQLELALSRLSAKELGQVFDGHSLEELRPVFSLIQREKMINCAKYMFPGQWAPLLDTKVKKTSVPKNLKEKLFKTSLEMKPLREDKDIEAMFMEADLATYLNQADTSDEREVYRALDSNSRIKKQRFPFYQVFQMAPEVIQKLSYDLPLQVWALALADCDIEERKKVYASFTDRQVYAVKQLMLSAKESDTVAQQRKHAKLMIRQACESLVPGSERVSDDSNYQQAA